MNKIAIIDYGMGNLHSVAKAIEHVGGGKPVVSSVEQEIRSADRVIFPGVGAIRDCMAEIRRLGFDHLLRELVRSRPVLAICVGMQALMEHSEENNGVDCIGLLEGRVKRFPGASRNAEGELLKVPHMGWNNVYQTRPHPMWKDIEDGGRFYFVHSYYVEPAKAVEVAGETPYPTRFTSAMARGNIFAVQFHPEKSQQNGLQLLKNFVHWDGES